MKFCLHVWRVFATGLSFAVFGLCSVLVTLIIIVFLSPLPVSPTTKIRWIRLSIFRSARIYLQMLALLQLIKIDFVNTERLNRPGQLIVANHPTLLDAIMLMSVMPNANFVMKSAVTKNLFMRRIALQADYLSNHQRGHEFIDKAVAAIASGETLIIFPEGTRTTDPHNMHFQRGAANIALRAKCPILPVVIACNPPTLRKKEPWYKVPTRMPYCQVSVLDSISGDSCVDASQPSGIQARMLTQHLQHVFALELQRRS